MHPGQDRQFLLAGIPPESATAAAAGSARLGNVDRQRPPAQVFSVQRIDRGLGLAIVFHLHEAETTGLAAVAILDYASRFNLAVLGESCPQVFVLGIETEVSYVYVQVALLQALTREPGANEVRTNQAYAV